MQNYKDLGYKILNTGIPEETRTGETTALYGETLKFDLRDGFPLMTTKYINFKNIIHETLWYLMGTDKITYLKNNGVNIWNNWADENDSIGPTYGVQWRNFEGIDQVRQIIETIKTDPDRRMIITGWNPTRLNEMALPPCLVMMHFHVENNNLHMTVYQRSADYCIGVPYDIAEMSLLLSLMANVTKLQPATLTMFYGNVHIYNNHIDLFKNQLLESIKTLPTLNIINKEDIDEYIFEDIHIHDYEHGPVYKYKISI